MRIATYREVELRCDLFVMLLIPVMLIFEAWEQLLIAVVSLTLHEISHTVVARALGYGVQAIEIQPFGFVARLKTRFHSSMSELVVALSGPLMSFFLGILGACAAYFSPALKPSLSGFITFNIALGAINLLPALPLDGGRILKSLLTLFLRPRLSTIITGALGVLAGIVLLVLGIVLFEQAPNITIPMMGVFLLLGALKELKHLDSAHLQTMMRRQRALRSGEGLRLHQLVLHADTTLQEAMRNLSPGKYNIIYVADDAMRILGQIDEQKLLLNIARLGGDARIATLLKGTF